MYADPVLLLLLACCQVFVLAIPPHVNKARAITSNPSVASATVTPTSSLSWYQFDCKAPAATDINMPGYQRWTAMDGLGAWGDANSYWHEHASDGVSYSEELSYFFKGPSNINCGILADKNGCDGTGSISCNQWNHPAGYFIVSSMMLLEDHFQNLYDAIPDARSAVTDQVPDITSTFSPSTTENSFKFTIDIGMMALTSFLAPWWNMFFKSTVPSDLLSTLKDTFNGFVSQTATLLKDESSLSDQVLGKENNVTGQIYELTEGWQIAIDGTVSDLFNGSAMSIGRLANAIQDGAFLQEATFPSSVENEEFMKTALYQFLIPDAWSLSDEVVFIMDGGIDCTDNVLPSSVSAVDEYIDSDSTPLGVCIMNHAYYLVATDSIPAESCDDQNLYGSGSCTKNKFVTPYGATQLDGSSWGSLTWQAMVNSSVQSYLNNDNQNGWATPDPTSIEFIWNMFDNGASTPGIFNFYMCSGSEAWNNWDEHTVQNSDVKSAHYPCN
ncbi:glycosyl hydrolase family 71-domain-containing protein [Penicillium riverlandense]|uniref:glycosyl hydrolase family 71-domain-containing protein n=1 Tax=Penicillium riverlandense TaxID=1903569 RepID=UPI0025493722|nr:glycosyl hydrolase family 71-domain-containing protein [Penicillium riverlandense]KAJ5826412.1 glycosyl hydrolase family 71-domain-containing protein [Penicillium riverlandense]